MYITDITFEICKCTKIIGYSNRNLEVLCMLIEINAFYDVFLVTNKWHDLCPVILKTEWRDFKMAGFTLSRC